MKVLLLTALLVVFFLMRPSGVLAQQLSCGSTTSDPNLSCGCNTLSQYTRLGAPAYCCGWVNNNTCLSSPPGQAGVGCTPGQGIDLADCLKLSDDTTVRSAAAYTSLSGLTNLVVSNLFVIAGVALFLYILFAGFIFATQGKAGAEKAKTIFTNSLAGFIIMISAYWIVQLIQYITGTNLPL